MTPAALQALLGVQSPGARLTVWLRGGGGPVAARLVAVLDGTLLYADDDGEMAVAMDQIERLKLHRAPLPEPSAAPLVAPVPSAPLAEVRTAEPGSPEQSPLLPTASTSSATERISPEDTPPPASSPPDFSTIFAEFLQPRSFPPLEPVWEAEVRGADLRPDLNKFRQVYEHAVRERDRDRFARLIPSVLRVVESFDSPQLDLLAGTLLWRMGDATSRNRAVEYFRRGVAGDFVPAARALAFTAAHSGDWEGAARAFLSLPVWTSEHPDAEAAASAVPVIAEIGAILTNIPGRAVPGIAAVAIASLPEAAPLANALLAFALIELSEPAARAALVGDIRAVRLLAPGARALEPLAPARARSRLRAETNGAARNLRGAVTAYYGAEQRGFIATAPPECCRSPQNADFRTAGRAA